jgi:hypothetical protein
MWQALILWEMKILICWEAAGLILAATSRQVYKTLVLSRGVVRFGARSQSLAWGRRGNLLLCTGKIAGIRRTGDVAEIGPGQPDWSVPLFAAWSQGNLDGQRHSISR